MIQNKDIIVVGIQPWDLEIGSNCKDIAKVFSKKNRVLYVNIPLNKKTAIEKKEDPRIKKRIEIIQGKKDGLEQIDENLWNLNPEVMISSINYLPFTSLFNILNKRNNRLFAEKIKNAVKRLNFKNYILFNDQHMFLGFFLKEYLSPILYVYYMRDNLLNVKYWKKHGKILEPIIIKKADLVLTNSLYYKEIAEQYNKESYMVGQGCDTTLYNDEKNTIKIADELTGIKKPIIGYVGYLSSKRLDIEILVHIAQERPEWQIILVGPEDESFKNSVLHQQNNVHFLGSKPPESLPQFIKGFDVTINPQQLTKATVGNYPRKIDEYLAMGKPVVGTLTKAMEYFKDVVYLGETKEDYIILIEKALIENTPEFNKKRSQTGQSHSWNNCVETIYERIYQKLNNN